MLSKLKLLVLCIVIPLATGSISGFITSESTEIYEKLVKPPFAPPGYVFPIVWTILYILMGIASYLVLTSGKDEVDVMDAFIDYIIQLGVNFFWSIFFFSLGWYLFSFIWLIFLWILIAITIYSFSRVSKPAALLMIPYLIWVTYAGYLNLFLYLLNR